MRNVFIIYRRIFTPCRRVETARKSTTELKLIAVDVHPADVGVETARKSTTELKHAVALCKPNVCNVETARKSTTELKHVIDDMTDDEVMESRQPENPRRN